MGNKYTKMLSSAESTEIATTHAPLDRFENGGSALNPAGQYTRGDFSMYIKGLDSLVSGFTPRAYKLVDFLIIQFGYVNNYKDTDNLKTKLIIQLDDYIKMLGRKNTPANRKKIRKEVKEDLDLIYNTTIQWNNKSLKFRIVDEVGVENGLITVNFGKSFSEHINTNQLIYYPMGLLKIDIRRPINYYFGRKLATHYSMTNNRKKGTHNIIKVKTLLNAVDGAIPTYEEVMDTMNGSVKQKIVDPFEKALNQLQTDKIIKWQYTGPKHQPLDRDTLKNNDYNIFINKMVSFEFKDWPPIEKD